MTADVAAQQRHMEKLATAVARLAEAVEKHAADQQKTSEKALESALKGLTAAKNTEPPARWDTFLDVIGPSEAAREAGFDNEADHREWLRLDGGRRPVLSLREKAQLGHEEPVGLVGTRNRALRCHDRDGNRDIAREQELQGALDEIDRHYGIDPVTGDRLDLGQQRLAFRLVAQFERAARVVQSALRHLLAPVPVKAAPTADGSVTPSTSAPSSDVEGNQPGGAR